MYISLAVKEGGSVRLAVATVLNNASVVPALIKIYLWFGVLSLLLLDERCASELIECC